MASPDREWFRAAIPAIMLETLVIQTCAFLQEEDWDSIVPPERRSISFDRRKQREKFRSKETMEKKGCPARVLGLALCHVRENK